MTDNSRVTSLVFIPSRYRFRSLVISTACRRLAFVYPNDKVTHSIETRRKEVHTYRVWMICRYFDVLASSIVSGRRWSKTHAVRRRKQRDCACAVLPPALLLLSLSLFPSYFLRILFSVALTGQATAVSQCSRWWR